MKRPILPTQIFRLFYIYFVMIRYGIDRVILSAPFFSPLRFLRHFNPFNWYTTKQQSHGESVRLAMEKLGPIFVKFGQVLSTRRDLLPDDIANELAKLQDQVPPFSSKFAITSIEAALKNDIAHLFKSFDPHPLASASIAQVHAAVLPNEQRVVVKVLRPNVEKKIRRDISLLYFAAHWAQKLSARAKRLRLTDVVAEFERTIIDELDLLREAGNASQLRRNFPNSDLLYVPEVYWPYTRKNILVIEHISGVPVSNIEELDRLGVDRKKLAENGVIIFFTQVFRDSFFHADMHPGNIFVDTTIPSNPKYIAVDFGIIGMLSPTDQRYLAENLLAFFNRDYRRIAILHVESQWVSKDTRVDVFESAIRTVCEPIFEKPLKDISFGQLLVRLFQTAGRFHMEIQPQLLLLQKTLLNIEGLGRELYPELDLWATAKPFLEKQIKQQFGPRALLRQLIKDAPKLTEQCLALPELLITMLKTITETTEK